MAILLGFGIGVWILGILWSIALICACIISKSAGLAKTLSVVLFAAIVLVSIILLLLPLEQPVISTQVELVDGEFILRIVLVIIAALVLIVQLIFTFVYDILFPVYAKPGRQLF